MHARENTSASPVTLLTAMPMDMDMRVAELHSTERLGVKAIVAVLRQEGFVEVGP